jgi:DNA polymerase-3 subunit epsilon
VSGAPQQIRDCCGVLDTLALARRTHPGQRNTLDALAKRYGVDTSMRELHGALLDARILAEVYLAMTGGQVSLLLDGEEAAHVTTQNVIRAVNRDGLVLPVLTASEDEERAHAALLAVIAKQSGGPALWQLMAEETAAPAKSAA